MPTIGRIVHYHDNAAAGPRAAVVADVLERFPNVLLNLTVFTQDGTPATAQRVRFVRDPANLSDPAAPYATWPPRE